METRKEAIEENAKQEANVSARSSTSWFWNPLNYLWGDSTHPVEVQQKLEENFTSANPQEETADSDPAASREVNSLLQKNLTEQQQVTRPLEEEEQPEEALAQQQAMAIFSSRITNSIDLLDFSNPKGPDINNVQNALPGNVDNACTPFVFRSVPPSPAASLGGPHPAQDTAIEDATVAHAIQLSMLTGENCKIDQTDIDPEEETSSAYTEREDKKPTEKITYHQELIALAAKLRPDNMRLEQQLEQLRQENVRKLQDQERLKKEKEELEQSKKNLELHKATLQSDNIRLEQQLEQLRQENARKLQEQEWLQKEKEELEQSKKNLESQKSTRQEEEKRETEIIEQQRIREDNSRQAAMLLQQEQQRAEARAAEERRKAEEAFSKSCSTGARTLEEHYRLARAAVMKAGF